MWDWVFENSEGQQKIKINMRQWEQRDARCKCFFSIRLYFMSEYIQWMAEIFDVCVCICSVLVVLTGCWDRESYHLKLCNKINAA